jgi:hypothetical protein
MYLTIEEIRRGERRRTGVLDMLQGSQYLVWYFQVRQHYTVIPSPLFTSFQGSFTPLLISSYPLYRFFSLFSSLLPSLSLLPTHRFQLSSLHLVTSLCNTPPPLFHSLSPIQCLGATIGRNVCLYPNGGDPMMTEPVRTHGYS